MIDKLSFTATVIAAGGQVVIDKHHFAEAEFKSVNVSQILRGGEKETVLTVVNSGKAYGKCPHCSGHVVERERRINGNDKCVNGHIYPSELSQ